MRKDTCVMIAAILVLCNSVVAQSPIDVVDTSFKLPILAEEIFYFGFAEGDQMLFSFEEENGKDLKEIEITELPATSRFKESKISHLQNKVFAIAHTGIYQFRFANTVMLQKNCRLKIQRVAATEATRNFNPTVYWRIVYDTVRRVFQAQTKAESYKTATLLPATVYYLEASTPESKPVITLPVNLPDFTSEWYYVFAVANDKEKANALKNSLQLNANLQKKITESGSAFVIDSSVAPAGSNPCRIYLLDQMNQQLFEARNNFRHFKEGSKENISSGLVKIKIATFPNAFLGIRNPNPEGIYVAIEAVAIIAPDDAVQTAEPESMTLKARKEPYLRN